MRKGQPQLVSLTSMKARKLKFAGCLEGVWKVSERCLEGVWKVSGRCLKSVCRVYRLCLDNMKMVSRG